MSAPESLTHFYPVYVYNIRVAYDCEYYRLSKKKRKLSTGKADNLQRKIAAKLLLLQSLRQRHFANGGI